MRSRHYVLIIVSAVMLAVLAGLYLIYFRCSGYSCILFKDKETFSVKNLYQDNNSGYRGLLDNGIVKVRVEKYTQLNKEQAQTDTAAKTMQILGLYEEAASPYPGVISDRITCDKRYRPVFSQANISSLPVMVYTGYLNDRLQYGSCIEEQLTAKVAAALFFCPHQRAWYNLEFIAPIHQTNAPDLMTYIRSIRCSD